MDRRQGDGGAAPSVAPSSAGALDSQTLISRNPRVVHRNLADDQGGVLLHLDTGAYHGLNSVGVLVWDVLQQDMAFERLVTQLERTLSNVPPDLGTQISSFLLDLDRRDLVQLRPRPAQP